LILAALTLFLMNAVAGRIWCGYLCPQTVWTDLFYAIERLVEGDRREHMRRDRDPWSFDKFARKGLKHFLWLLVAWWTGGAWVLYFADAPTLVKDLATVAAPFVAYLWIAILTVTTYALAGHLREQVCLYMCPWPRIQAALTDEHALNVTYRYDRGEPRGSVKKNAALRAKGEPAGDCVDCLQCVYVCPTGVDIRQGPSLGCIQCGLCIDACDEIMARVNRPARLIGYDTDIRVEQRAKRAAVTPMRVIRPRTLIYAAAIVLVSGTMLYALATRSTLGVSAMHDRNPVFVRLADGSIRNGYTIRILNMKPETRYFALRVDGLAHPAIEIAGATRATDSTQAIEVGPDQTREFRLLATENAEPNAPAARDITIVVSDIVTGESASTLDHFRTAATGAR
jgi:cytochrome c oxidase accessory protein FixG